MGLLSKFKQSRRGNFAILFAVTSVPMLAGVAMMVDYANMSKRQSDLQNAVDSAVLMAGAYYRDNGVLPSRKMVMDILRPNFREKVRIARFRIHNDEVYLQARIETPGIFLNRLEDGTFKQLADATVPIGQDGKPYEIALVLDTTFSMSADNKMVDLKASATRFVEDMFRNVPVGSDDLKMAIVPFSEYVNIGTSFRGAPWLNIVNEGSETVCSSYSPLIDTSLCRTETVDYDGVEVTTQICEMGAYGPPVETCSQVVTEWQGCVASRLPPYNVLDSDFSAHQITGISTVNCSHTLTPLTNDEALLEQKILELPTALNTYTASGVAWGMRVLSPSVPFTEGSAYSSPTEKVMIIMTDGDNTLGPTEDGGGQFAWHTTFADPQLTNQATLDACAEARSKGIVIHAIAFGTSITSDGKNVMKGCAASTGRYYEARDGVELQETFDSISDGLFKFRLSS